MYEGKYHIKTIWVDDYPSAEVDMNYEELCEYLLTTHMMACGDETFKVEISFL